MNIRKRNKELLTPLAANVLHIGLTMIYFSLVRFLYEVQSAAPFPASRSAYFRGLLEYPVAALALLTAAVFLIVKFSRSSGVMRLSMGTLAKLHKKNAD